MVTPSSEVSSSSTCSIAESIYLYPFSLVGIPRPISFFDMMFSSSLPLFLLHSLLYKEFPMSSPVRLSPLITIMLYLSLSPRLADTRLPSILSVAISCRNSFSLLFFSILFIFPSIFSIDILIFFYMLYNKCIFL